MQCAAGLLLYCSVRGLIGRSCVCGDICSQQPVMNGVHLCVVAIGGSVEGRSTRIVIVQGQDLNMS